MLGVWRSSSKEGTFQLPTPQRGSQANSPVPPRPGRASSFSTQPAMDPYEADPSKIPSTDLYGDIPHFGRYLPRPNDFKPDAQYIQSTTPEAIAYWTSVLGKCTPEERIYENETGGRDVFALGGVIVKSSHLKDEPGRDYTLADANEVAAITLARTVLGSIRTPDIYFAGKVYNLLLSPL